MKRKPNVLRRYYFIKIKRTFLLRHLFYCVT